MTEAVAVALITAAGGVLAGWFTKVGIDKMNNGRHSSNGGGQTVVDRAISQRAEVEFQTRMTVLMTQLTAAIEKGHDKAIEQMRVIAGALAESASAIQKVHDEVSQQREQLRPALGAMYDTKRVVQEIQRTIDRSPMRATGSDK